MNRYVTVGLGVLAGAALFEAALIPGIIIGGAVLLAPRCLPRLSRRLLPDAERVAGARREPGAAPQDDAQRVSRPAGLQIKQAVAKTITFRIISTGLDFTTNYVVLGELAIAAGYFRPPHPLRVNNLPRKNSRTAGRIGEVRLGEQPVP